jgi:hypothetical protein
MDFLFSWWPEIPVVLAIFVETVIMGDLVYSVHQKEKASSQYTGGSKKLSKMVSEQAMWFVGAFYVTWIPYLVLQVRQASQQMFFSSSLTLFPVSVKRG